MSPKAPAARGFTFSERRSLNFENRTLWWVMFVAAIAAILSFAALQWVGSQFMDWRLAFGLPLAIDGFAIACSLGVVRSQAAGEHFRERASEWFGIFLALGLSIAGNVFHGLHTVTDAIPRELVIAYSAAIPTIVAYGIHVYGRAMHKGISAHVLVDDPDKIHFDVHHLGEDLAAPKAAPRVVQQAPKQVDANRPAAAAVEAARTATPTAAPAPAEQQPVMGRRMDATKDRYRALVRESVEKGQQPVAADIRRQVAQEGHPIPSEGAGRKWVQAIVDELNAVVPATDRGAADLAVAGSRPAEARSA